MSLNRLLDDDDQLFVEGTARDLHEAGDGEQGICSLLNRVNERLCTEALSIFILSPARDALVLRYAATPEGQGLIGLRMPFGQGVVGWVVRYNEDLIVPETARDPRFYSGVDVQSGFVTRSILCVPIAREGEVVGAIEALNKTTGHFDSDDVVLLQAIAQVVSGAVSV